MKRKSFTTIARYLLVIFTGLAAAITAFSGAAAQAGHAPKASPELLTCPGTPAQCFTDVPSSSPFFENANRLYMQEVISGYPCGGLTEPCDSENRPYYRPGNTVTRQQMTKFVDNARRLPYI